jgi:mannose-6-phosphate isomerase-like protein (cupin superfamily)
VQQYLHGVEPARLLQGYGFCQHTLKGVTYMKRVKVDYRGDFRVIAGNGRSQAAVMVLPPGESEGGNDNRHKGSDQWLYVAAGKGSATIKGKVHRLSRGTLLLIEHGETHEIKNTGETPLKTLNFYVPPAYDEDEEPLPSGKP